MKSISCLFSCLVVFVAMSTLTYAAQGVKSKKSNSIISFEGKWSSAQKSAAIGMTEAIRSGSVEEIRKYVKKNGDPQSISNFWSGVDELSKLKFRARVDLPGFIIYEAANGMSSCHIIKENGRFVIDECTFNDGN